MKIPLKLPTLPEFQGDVFTVEQGSRFVLRVIEIVSTRKVSEVFAHLNRPLEIQAWKVVSRKFHLRFKLKILENTNVA